MRTRIALALVAPFATVVLAPIHIQMLNTSLN